ncbi:MAG: acetyl-CoA carboxylase, biotin carboxyl carrier protein [Oscillospiraceae bacterium]|nr:acetyl-CoA carboxylase, biotin carboxyl carrier protein [Oscillospiraceae bacterium]
MDIKKIKSIAEILDKYGLTEIEYVEDKDKIVMKRDSIQTVINEPIENTYNFSGVHEVKAPLIGVFYIAPSPDAKPYVEIGSKVKKGDVLCIIEAMKLMNEINADFDGEIVDICAQNGEIVEYNQTLFKII